MAGVERTVAVLRAVAADDGVTLAQLARAAELDEATALRYVSSLVTHDLVTRDASGLYRIGLGLFLLGQRIGAIRDVRAIALPHIEKLQLRFEETVNLAYSRQGTLVVIDVIEGVRSIRRGATVGQPDVWHASALGKAILSMLPEDDATEVLDAYERLTYTEHTKVALEDLHADLRATKARGYAIDDEEFELGLRCVGAPVLDRRGQPSYALSISGVAQRMTAEVVEQMGEAVAEAARLVSLGLGFIPNDRKGAS